MKLVTFLRDYLPIELYSDFVAADRLLRSMF
jgi:hypothetical protein